MEVLLTTLLVPSLGALLLTAEWQSRVAWGRSTRDAWRRALKGLAVLLALLALGMLVHAVVRLITQFAAEQVILGLARGLLIALALRAAQRALQVSRLPDVHAVDVPQPQPSTRGELRVCGWLLAGFPLLWVAVPVLLLVSPLLLGMALTGMTRRAERARFLWLMAVAAEHQMDLATEIDAFAGGAHWWSRERYVALAGRLRNGSPLSEALAADRQLLPAEMVAAIRVSERTGTLPATLQEMAARYLEGVSRPQGDGAIFGLLSYYWVVLVLLGGAVGALSYWVAPTMQQIFSDFDAALPPLTRRVFEVTEASSTLLLFLLPLLAIPAAALLLLSTRAVDRGELFHWAPLGRWFPRGDAPGVLRWLALAVGAARPLPALIGEVAERLPRRDLGARLQRAARAMDGGSDPWVSLAAERFLTPREVVAVRAAHRAGHAPIVLMAIADGIERARLRRILWWIEWLKPIVMLVLGGLVAVLCVAYFLPLIAVFQRLL